MVHTEEITTLEWDVSGTKLLIGDVAGNIQIWTMKDYLINEWQLVHTHAFSGEKILSAIWFHNGIKISINPEKKDSLIPYSEKYNYSKFGASVRQFGGKPTEGCLAVSSSGLVCCLIFLSDGNILSAMEILGQFRSKLKSVDVCYAKNGDFLVVTSNGCVQSSINCYRVTVKINNNGNSQERSKCSIVCQPYTSFYMSCSTNTTETYKSVSHLKFLLREAAEAVIVAASGSSGSTVELWELREKPVTIHKMFQKNNNSGDTPSTVPTPKTVLWQHSASSSAPVSVVSIATPRMSLFDSSPPPSYILVAYKDNTIKCFFRENLYLVCTVSLNVKYVDPRDLKSFGMQKPIMPTVSNIADMQFTWSSCAMVAIDSLSQMFLYRLSPITFTSEPGLPMNTHYAQTMLEYCLITGNDWWDIMLSMRPNLIENVCDKITENFMQKQPLSNQQKWLSRFLAMKASLYRCLNSNTANNTGQCKAGDFYTLIMLNAIATALKSLLRPRDSQENEGPAEQLSNIIQNKGSENQFMNVDKILMNLESKQFWVESTIVQSCQHLHQWVADLALYLLASLPQQCHNHYRFPGVSIIC